MHPCGVDYSAQQRLTSKYSGLATKKLQCHLSLSRAKLSKSHSSPNCVYSILMSSLTLFPSFTFNHGTPIHLCKNRSSLHMDKPTIRYMSIELVKQFTESMRCDTKCPWLKNNNKVLVPIFLGLAMNPQQISQGQRHMYSFPPFYSF